MFELDKLVQLADNIQPYVKHNNVFNVYVGTSLFVLFMFAIVEMVFRENAYEKFVALFVSEQETFKYYSSLSILKQIQAHLSYLFFALQLAYLLPLLLHSGVLDNFLLKAVSIYGLFLFKSLVYNSLYPLLRNRLDVGYFLYNYQSALFYFSLPLFVCVILISYVFTINTIMHVLLFCMGLFYAWLFIRLFFISTRYKYIRSVYFFLYLCALEFVPILLGMKIVEVI